MSVRVPDGLTTLADVPLAPRASPGGDGVNDLAVGEGVPGPVEVGLQDYVAYDKATWRVWFTREGLDEALNRSTGSTHDDIQNSYETMTAYDTPPVMIGVGGIDVSGDKQTADVTICSDRTQMKATDFQGNDVTQASAQRRLALLVRMVPLTLDTLVPWGL